MTIDWPNWIQSYFRRFRSSREGSHRSSVTNDINLEDVPRRPRHSVVVGVGTTKLLSANYESLDYDLCENKLFQDEERTKGEKFLTRKSVVRWVVFFFIGVVTACVGVFVDICIHELSDLKFKVVTHYMTETETLDSNRKDNLYIPYLIWTSINVGSVMVGAFLVAYIEPVAAGSGIPQIKCYLNGVKIKNMVRVRTLFVKVVGVISTVVSGLAAGKEGPMIHSGAFVAAALSQGKSSSLRTDFGILKYFREDHEKRDFVSGGAAAGVAAAFGAPVGGVLFSLEEGASFWNQSLTWRIFFASSLSAFTLNIILTAYYTGSPGQLSHDGLLNFGHFDNLEYQIIELPLFMVMGAIGGCMGSIYTYVNYKLTVFRMRYVRTPSLKVLEACIVAMMSATFGMIGIYSTRDCKPLGQDPSHYPVQIHCPDGEYNTMAAIWLQVPEESVRSLFHDPKASHQVWTLVMFLFTYFGLSIWTYGLSVSAGIFIPCLLTGAAWGRLIGIGLEYLLPNVGWVDPGKYALVGAAAQLGGVVRMTISLTVILIEATGNINFGLPLMITLITAKWVGDLFTEGFYDVHIQLGGVPLLGWDPPPLSSHIRASSFMSCSPVKVFTPKVKVRDIVRSLTTYTYNGFPIVESFDIKTREDGLKSYGKLGGLILRSQLILLLKNKVFTNFPENVEKCKIGMFRLAYPRFPQIEDIELSEEEKEYYIDLSPFMNPSPYAVTHRTSLPRVFRLFRALGLRHLVIVSEVNEVVGMVTRKDLAKYRWEEHGKSGIKILTISNAL